MSTTPRADPGAEATNLALSGFEAAQKTLHAIEGIDLVLDACNIASAVHDHAVAIKAAIASAVAKERAAGESAMLEMVKLRRAEARAEAIERCAAHIEWMILTEQTSMSDIHHLPGTIRALLIPTPAPDEAKE
jgi:hypothetical protein